jgi:hypothetical protein
MFKRSSLYVLFLAALPAIAVANPITVNTDPGWNGSNQIGGIGNPDTSTYGEAVLTPGGATTVDSFSVWMQLPTGFQFQGFVAPWDDTNSQLTAAPTYLSGVVTATDGNLDQYTFTGVNAAVTAGAFYQFGITVDNVYAADSGLGNGTMAWDYGAATSSYHFDWSNDSGTGFSNNLLYANWNNTGDGNYGSAAFVVNYDSAPEPGSVILLGSGALLLAGAVRRKARQQ